MSLNKTGKEITKAKINSIEHHTKNNMSMFDEYKNSKFQFTMTFSDFKKMKRKRKK